MLTKGGNIMPDIVGGDNDGYIYTNPGAWNTIRAVTSAATADSNNTTDSNAVSHIYFTRRGTHVIRRAFFEFDTTGITTVAPSAATLKVFGVTQDGGDVMAVRSNQTSDPLHRSDFAALVGVGDPPTVSTQLGNTDGSNGGTFASVSGLAYLDDFVETWSTSGYNDLTLNETARDDMLDLDTLKVCIMIKADYEDDATTPGTDTDEMIGLRWQENGAGKYPYIDYTEGTAAAADNATFFGANF